MPPDGKIDLLGSPGGSLAKGLLWQVRGMLVLQPSWRSGSSTKDSRRAAWREHALINTIAERDYDAMIVFTGPGQSPWPAAHVGLLAGIPIRVVRSTEQGGGVATHQVPLSLGDEPVSIQHLRLLAALGVPAGPRLPAIRIPDQARMVVQALLADLDEQLSVVAVPADHGPDRPEQLLDRVRGPMVLVPAMAGSGDDSAWRELRQHALSRGVPVLPALGVAELAALFALAGAVYAADRTSAALATAVGTRAVLV
ncbi:hypothetical protein D5S17_11815 [Pseudonocardiaceae bacterium YIM PH 21723]|nr:hypothetical protein D5S17_11815 [Pseudonocardiaceae bacterium YIM PH 21723]